MSNPFSLCNFVAEVGRRLSIVREVETEVDAKLKRSQTLRHAMLQSAFNVPIESPLTSLTP